MGGTRDWQARAELEVSNGRCRSVWSYRQQAEPLRGRTASRLTWRGRGHGCDHRYGQAPPVLPGALAALQGGLPDAIAIRRQIVHDSAQARTPAAADLTRWSHHQSGYGIRP
jgi:hypothetical protein